MRLIIIIILTCVSSFVLGQSAAVITIIKLKPEFKYKQQIRTIIDKQFYDFDSLNLNVLTKAEWDILVPDTGGFKDYPIPYCYSIQEKTNFWTIVFLTWARGPILILMNFKRTGQLNQIFKINASISDEGSYSLCESRFLGNDRFNVITVEKGLKYGLDVNPNIILGDSTNTTYRQEKDGKILIVSQSINKIEYFY